VTPDHRTQLAWTLAVLQKGIHCFVPRRFSLAIKLASSPKIAERGNQQAAAISNKFGQGCCRRIGSDLGSSPAGRVLGATASMHRQHPHQQLSPPDIPRAIAKRSCKAVLSPLPELELEWQSTRQRHPGRRQWHSSHRQSAFHGFQLAFSRIERERSRSLLPDHPKPPSGSPNGRERK